MLGQYDGVFDAGELIKWIEATTTPGWRCGCGAQVTLCPVWSQVLRAVAAQTQSGQTKSGLTDAATDGLRAFRRLRMLPEVSRHRRADRSGHVDSSRQLLLAMYHAILSASGARVIVDSSKSPVWSELVEGLDDADVRVVHLVRDPRATAFSTMRVRGTPSGVEGHQMTRIRPVRTATYWAANHAAVATVVRRSVGPGRYLRVHYEELAAAPRESVEQILAFLEEPLTGGPFVDERTVDLAPTHNLSGNAMRFDHGRVRITPDDEWTTELPRADRLVTLAIAGPVMTWLRRVPSGRRTSPQPGFHRPE